MLVMMLFFGKHSAELEEREVTILLRVALCEEVPHLALCFEDIGFGLERSADRWFRASLETF